MERLWTGTAQKREEPDASWCPSVQWREPSCLTSPTDPARMQWTPKNRDESNASWFRPGQRRGPHCLSIQHIYLYLHCKTSRVLLNPVCYLAFFQDTLNGMHEALSHSDITAALRDSLGLASMTLQISGLSRHQTQVSLVTPSYATSALQRDLSKMPIPATITSLFAQPPPVVNTFLLADTVS